MKMHIHLQFRETVKIYPHLEITVCQRYKNWTVFSCPEILFWPLELRKLWEFLSAVLGEGEVSSSQMREVLEAKWQYVAILPEISTVGEEQACPPCDFSLREWAGTAWDGGQAPGKIHRNIQGKDRWVSARTMSLLGDTVYIVPWRHRSCLICIFPTMSATSRDD